MLEVKDLEKSYGKTRVLSGVNLQIEDNKIYGLLGRNAVGKTSLLRLIACQIKRDKGTISIDNNEVFENAKALSDICMVGETFSAGRDLRVREIFKLARDLYKDWDEEYKNSLVDKFALNTRKKYERLSKGMQTIVGIIIGLASGAKYTLVDEPSIGLDANHRDLFYKLLLEEGDKNRTFIISSHLIDELSMLFEEVIILKDEGVLLQEELPTLMEKSLYLFGKEETIASIIDMDQIIEKESFGQSVRLGIFGDLSQEKRKELKDKGIEVTSMPLQKLFIHLTREKGE